MKEQTTKKFIMNKYKNIIKVGYCELSYVLRFKEPKYYTAGVYGWNADIYEIDPNTVIVTGYRPFGNIDGYGKSRDLEEKARELIIKWEWDKMYKLDELLEKFISEVK